MRTIRIFISSPGDVAEERERARQVVEGLRRRYAGRLDLHHLLWEDLPLQPDMSFQQGIDLVLSNRGVEVAVFILWSRLGTPTGPMVVREDGVPYRSGTEREFDLMMRAREKSRAEGGKARPDILVYTRRDDASFEERMRGTSTSQKHELVQQKLLVETFLKEEFNDAASGTNVGAYHSFDRPQSFSQRLRIHFTELLDELVDDGEFGAVWDLEKQGPPFMGLDPFGEAQAAVFFGREDEVLEARRALAEHARQGCAFLLITGASGSGKSSLARAGLLPAVAEQELDETIAEWRRLIVTPTDLGLDPLARLLERLAEPDILPGLRPEGVPFDEVVASFRKDPGTAMIFLKQAVAASSKASRGGVRLLLLLDQLEEVFAFNERDTLLALVEALARSGVVWVVATIRADFLPKAYESKTLARMLEGRQVLTVVAPEPDALRRMIVEPARLAGLSFEKRGERHLSDKILADAAQHADLLPLVEFLLLELFVRRSPEGQLSWSVYSEELKGVEGALRQRAEEVFNGLSADAQASLPQVLKRLVTVGEAEGGGEDGAERPIRQRMRQDAFPIESPARYLIDAFVEARLFTASSNSVADSGESFVTVAHEALLRVWPRATAWTEGNRDLLRARARVGQRLRQWQAGDCDESLLLQSGRDLGEVEKQLITDPDAFSAMEVEFIRASQIRSQDALERERLRREEAEKLHAAAETARQEAEVERGRAIDAMRETERHLQEANRQLEKASLEEGKAWLERANLAWKGEKNALRAMMLAGRAVGFHGFGRREKEPPAFEMEYPNLLGKAMGEAINEKERKQEIAALEELLESVRPKILPVWSSPVLKHHGKGVLSLAFNHDGTLLASGSEDETVKVWDTATGDEVLTLKGHSSMVTYVTFSPDGTHLATASDDGVIKLWKTTSGDEMGPIEGHSKRVNSLSFSPDGIVLASASDDGKVKLWNVATGSVTATIEGSSSGVASIAFSPCGDCLAFTTGDNTLKRWDVSKRRVIETVLEDSGGTVFFNRDGTLLAAGTAKDTVRIWKAASGELVSSFVWHMKRVKCVAFSADWTVLASGSSDGSARLWNPVTGDEYTNLAGHSDFVNCLSLSPDGAILASGSNDGEVKLWDVATKMEISAHLGHSLKVTSVAFSPDGTSLASGAWDDTIKLWNIATGECFSTLQPEAIAEGSKRIQKSFQSEFLSVYREAGSGKVNCIAFSPDGKRILSGSGDRTIRLWDTTTSILLATIEGHSSGVAGVAFGPDGRQFASASWDDTVKLWDASTGGELMTLRAQSPAVSVAFSPDGGRLASGLRDKTIKLWDTTTGAETATLTGHSGYVTSVAFKPDGTRIASGDEDGSIRIWETLTDNETPVVLAGHTGSVQTVAFSPEGMLLASGSEDATVKLWDSETGELLSTFEGHTLGVTKVSFSHDGIRLASGSKDGTVRMWVAANGPGWLARKGHLLSGKGVIFNLDGSMALTWESDEPLMLWDTQTGERLAIFESSGDLRSVAFHPSGAFIAFSCSGGVVGLRDASTGRILAFTGHSECVNSVAFSPDGKVLASASSDRTVKFWDVAMGVNVATITGHSDVVSKIVYFRDGARIATVSWDKSVRIWDTVTGEQLAKFEVASYSSSALAISPDGNYLACTAKWGPEYGDHGVKIWSVTLSKEVATLIGIFNDIAFSPDGRRLASTSYGTLKLWDVETGKEIASGTGGQGGVCFSPDGKVLASGGDDVTLRFWDAQNLAPRNMSLPLDLCSLMSAGLLKLQNREVSVASSVSKNLFHSVEFFVHQVRKDDLTAMATPNLAPLRYAALRLGLMSRCGQWRAARAWWANQDQEIVGALRHEYVVMLLGCAGDPVTAAVPSSLAELTAEVSSNLIPESLEDIRISVALGEHLLRVADPDQCPGAEWQTFVDRIVEIGYRAWHEGIACRLEQAKESDRVSLATRERLIDEIRAFAERHPASDSPILLRAYILDRDSSDPERIAAEDRLLAMPVATAKDFTDAAYVAAIQGNRVRSEALIKLATNRFPDDSSVPFMSGWTQINFGAPGDALRTFEFCRSNLNDDENPSAYLLAGLAISQWLVHDRDTAVVTFKQLIHAGRSLDEPLDWANPLYVCELNWPEAETAPLEALRAATVTAHPELSSNVLKSSSVEPTTPESGSLQ